MGKYRYFFAGFFGNKSRFVFVCRCAGKCLSAGEFSAVGICSEKLLEFGNRRRLCCSKRIGMVAGNGENKTRYVFSARARQEEIIIIR